MLPSRELIHMVQSHGFKQPVVNGPGGDGFREDKETLALKYCIPERDRKQTQTSAVGCVTTQPWDRYPASSTEVETHRTGGW